MRPQNVHVSLVIFFSTLAATFLVSYLGQRHSPHVYERGLAGHRLNKWLVGLSGGATANSGFVVTGAVGLGYTQGIRWLLLPLAWLLGDIVFWTLFPARINAAGSAITASTLTDLVVFQVGQGYRAAIKLLIAAIVIVCLSGYVSAQWIAGEKFLHGAFQISGATALLIFGALIVAYTSVGGFRGSVYADTLQALIRIVGTTIALTAVFGEASADWTAFNANIASAGPAFLRLSESGSVVTVAAFIVGFAFAAIGFGLGQPQMVSRYLAGDGPEETRSAWWIYMLFVQFTWIAMTLFGITLRGVLPGLEDPEAGLSLFFSSRMGQVMTGLIVADIFATIAATSNSLLVAISQTIKFDLFDALGRPNNKIPLWIITAFAGAATMLVSMGLNASVVNLALGSVSLMGAGLAPAVLVRTLGWESSGEALVAGIVTGFATAIAWRLLGWNSFINEAFAGILLGVGAHALVAKRLVAGRILESREQ